MGMWRRIVEFLSTDVEVVLVHDPECPLRIMLEETDGGGCLSVTTDEQYRHVFFGEVGNLSASRLVLRDARGHVVAMSRGPFGRVIIMTGRSGSRPLQERTEEHILRVQLGGDGLSVPDPRGGRIAVRRFRHRDFRMFKD